MTAWTIAIAYLIAAAVVLRVVAGHIAWDRSEREGEQWPSTEDWANALFLALFPAVVAPLTIICLLAGDRWAAGAEARAIRRRQAEHIQQLEAELYATGQ